jgi:hypothetical protein
MSVGIQDAVSDLIITRRVMITSKQLEARRRGEDIKVQSAKEAMEEDQLLLSGQVKDLQDGQNKSLKPDNTNIKLSDLISRLKQNQGRGSNSPAANSSQTVVAATYRKTEIEVEFKVWSPIQGLVVRNKNLAETDRYALEFQNGSTFKITDKWSGQSTTIWGDPHVDTSDQEGNSNGEFADLKSSDTHTTLQLEDGTRVTFTARDNGVIEQVNIFKGNQHLSGIGSASSDWTEENGLFATQVLQDAPSAASNLPIGDAVFAGGDGADWFDASGKPVWGHSNSVRPTPRPYASVEITIKQQIEQFAFSGIIEDQS